MQKIFLGLPAYNEERSIAPLFTRIEKAAASCPFSLAVMIYDDGCQDGTKEEVFKWQSRLELIYLDGVTNKGLGTGMNTLLSEFKKVGKEGDFLVVMDCDDTHDPAQILQMLNVFSKHPRTDIVVASRYRRKATITGVPFHRLALSLIAALLYKTVHPIYHARDYTCGYRMYRYAIVKRLLASFGDFPLRERGFACMVELLLKLKKVGAKLREIPLQLAYDNKLSASKMDVSGNAFRLLKKLLGWRFGEMK